MSVSFIGKLELGKLELEREHELRQISDSDLYLSFAGKDGHYDSNPEQFGTELLQLYLTMIYRKDWIKLEYNRLDDIIECQLC